jgi:signal transduction histidine kinase
MPLETPPPRSRSPAHSRDVELLRAQCEANEKLVLATIRKSEDADAAREAQHAAETDASELRSREEALRVVADLRELLIGMVGHDLRTPLSTILMASGLLIAHGSLGEADARLVNRVVSSGQRMARMLNHLLDFTQARLGGELRLALAPTDLAAVCRDIAEELRISSSADIELEITGELVGPWDADRLAELVSNLVGNAIDHHAPGTAIAIRAREGGDSVVVEVTNEGASIPPDLLPVIFDAFRRLEPPGAATRKGEHMGLGLFISAEIVRAHGGSIEARSDSGSTTFTVRLPKAPAAASQGPESTRSAT